MDILESERFIDTPQGAVYAKSWAPSPDPGDAPPMVLLHDSLGCVSLWRDLPAQLCARLGRTIIAYDRLGFGRSAKRFDLPPLDFIAREAGEEFARVAQGLQLSRFALLGYSVGGEMAVEIAAAHPEACEGVITMSAQAFIDARLLAGVRAAQQHFSTPEAREKLARHHGDRVDWALRAWFEIWLSPQFASWTMDEALARLRCPLLAIHGAADAYGTAAFPERICAKAGGPAEMALLPGVGHAPHLERLEQVLALVERFCAASQRGARAG